jgi:hypothetical protein
MHLLFSFFLCGLICLSYIALSYLFTYFFESRAPRFHVSDIYAILGVAVYLLVVFYVTRHIPNDFWANRFLHAFGGGFAAYIICYLVARAQHLHVGPIKFLVFSCMVVTSLGVANELMELFLQINTHLVFADSITDTWLDLLSNSVGILLAAGILQLRS